MKAGDTIWRFNANRRVYREGRSAPVWREHWEPMQVIGETKRSWLVGYEHSPTRVPKVGADPRMWAFSQEDIRRREWVEDNRRVIADAIFYRCSDYDTLKQIAKLLEGRGGEKA